jgi:hypothetical protein
MKLFERIARKMADRVYAGYSLLEKDENRMVDANWHFWRTDSIIAVKEMKLWLIENGQEELASRITKELEHL